MTELDDLVAGLTRIQTDRIDIEAGYALAVKQNIPAPPPEEHRPLHDTHAPATRVTVWATGVTMGGRRKVVAPCLLAQLAAAIETGQDRTGTRSVPGSRPPVDMTALDLWGEIAQNLSHWARALGVSRRGYSVQPAANRPRHDGRYPPLPPIAALLRAVAAAARDRAEDGVLSALTRSCRSWTDRIATLFTPADGQHAIYGAVCPNCQQSTVITDRDGENIQTPAIIRTRDRERPLTWFICQACGWQRGTPSYDTEEVPA